MRVMVCYPIKSLVHIFMPKECEVVTVETVEEMAAQSSAYKPEAVVFFSEAMNQPPWEWMDYVSTFLPQEVMKVIIPLHRDEEIINRIIETKGLMNMFVFPARLSNEEIKERLQYLFGIKHSILFTAEPKPSGKIHTLLSYGATGVTTFCINYSAMLASQLPSSTIAFIDFNLEKPDLTEFFQLSNSQLAFLRPYLLNTNKAEQQDWKSVFKRSDQFPNLYFSTGAIRWKVYEISSLLQSLRKQFDYIFIDWGFCFREQEVLQQLLILSDTAYMFVRPDPFNLESSRKWLMRWKDAKIPFQIIVSHYQKDDVSIPRIQSIMRTPIAGIVPRISGSRVSYSLQSKSVLVKEAFPPRQYVASLKAIATEEVDKIGEEVAPT
ncbi:hypothetical protein ACQCN2_21135 [Brevibacillus ginsengisoli]|uniref:hypothetical protein n=1 Tax=Brevibacillus ginsengisoli TaxID=363854 RepID=UPI003CED7037